MRRKVLAVARGLTNLEIAWDPYVDQYGEGASAADR